MSERPPHNYEIEKIILGSCMMNQECLITALASVKPEDFFHPVHRKIYETIQEVFNSGNYPAEDSVVNHLMRKGELKGIGGATAVTSCTFNVAPTMKKTEYHVSQVIDFSQCRQLITLGTNLREKGSKAAEKAKEIISAGMHELLELSNRESISQGMTITEAMASSDEYFRKVDSGELPPAIKTGFEKIDSIMALHPSDVWVVGARPSHGKTAFAVNVSLNVCRKGGSVLFITTEMLPQQMSHRFASLVAGISSNSFRFGRVKNMMQTDQFNELKLIGNRLRIEPLYGGTELDIGLIIRRALMRMPEISLVVIDYLQTIEYSKRSLSLRESVTKISNYIKRLATQLGLRVLMLSQLTRPMSGDRMKNPRPTMFDLRETGAIEQDADNIGLIWPDGREDELKEWTEWEVKFLMEKSRNGATGQMGLLFRKDIGKFYESDISGPPPITQEQTYRDDWNND